VGLQFKKYKNLFRGSFGAAEFLTRMLSLNLRSAFPSKHAEHMLHAQCTHQFLTRMLSISVKIPNLKRAFNPC
jgi:hypothetical protein